MKRWVIHGALFLITFVTATAMQGPIYASSIMVILLGHELGHYVQCRRYGVAATFPLFIPMPNILGTMGAVIAMKSPIPSRKALFDIGVTGPLVGLALAIPACAIGLYFSEVKTLPKGGENLILGEPLLFQWLSMFILGPIPEGKDVYLHPIAFAGWATFFVTAINLFPVGQLDGGHVMYALIGERNAKRVAWAVAAFMGYLAMQYHSMWFFFLVMILLFVWKHPPPIDDKIPISSGRKWLGVFTFFLLGVCFTPVPFEFRM